MPACWNLQSFLPIAMAFALLLDSTPAVRAFVPVLASRCSSTRTPTPALVFMAAEKVEVCGFKDCKRVGGGPRLEKLIAQVLEEEGLVDSISVESCECQGECGYGPNLLVVSF